MSATGSVTYWIGRLKAGDRDEASRRLWDVYAARVVGVVQGRLAGLPRLRTDAEDVALSALTVSSGGRWRVGFPALTTARTCGRCS